MSESAIKRDSSSNATSQAPVSNPTPAAAGQPSSNQPLSGTQIDGVGLISITDIKKPITQPQMKGVEEFGVLLESLEETGLSKHNPEFMAAIQSAEELRQAVFIDEDAIKFLRKCTTHEVIHTAQFLHNLAHISEPRPPETLTDMARCFGEQGKAVMFTDALRFAAAAHAVRNALHTVPPGKATICANAIILFWSGTAPFLLNVDKDSAPSNPPQTSELEDFVRARFPAYNQQRPQEVQSLALLRYNQGLQAVPLQASQLQIAEWPVQLPAFTAYDRNNPFYVHNPYGPPMPPAPTASPQVLAAQHAAQHAARPPMSATQLQQTQSSYGYGSIPPMTAVRQLPPPQMSTTQTPSAQTQYGYGYNPQMAATQQLTPAQMSAAQSQSAHNAYGYGYNPQIAAAQQSTRAQMSATQPPVVQTPYDHGYNPQVTVATPRQGPGNTQMAQNSAEPPLQGLTIRSSHRSTSWRSQRGTTDPNDEKI